VVPYKKSPTFVYLVILAYMGGKRKVILWSGDHNYIAEFWYIRYDGRAEVILSVKRGYAAILTLAESKLI
jgi:hypothetical protein